MSKEIQAEVLTEALKVKRAGVQPGLAVVLVGENPASQIYVRSKVTTCQTLGMHSEKIEMPETSSTEEILEQVRGLNRRKDIHGILVQVPLPPHVERRVILDAVHPEKDVDGFHPVNVGLLVAGKAILKPCTPAGIMEILKKYRIPLAGRRAAVIGRSDIVGKPISLLLLHEDVTVTICHSKTPDLPAVARDADILIAAIGRPAFVDDSFVKPGATVIDVGVNRLDSPQKIREIFGEGSPRLDEQARKGYTLIGDVHPTKVFPRVSYLTPVPGGVGPLTIAMLMANTVRAAALAAGVSVFGDGGTGSGP